MSDIILVKNVSALEKLTVEEKIENLKPAGKHVILNNEKYSLQFAYTMAPEYKTNIPFKVKIESPIAPCIRLYRVMQMACPTPVMEDETDEYVLKSEAGLMPDLLMPVGKDQMLHLTNHSLNSFWIDVMPEGKVTAGLYPITLIMENADNGSELCRCRVEIEILDKKLPEQKTIHTEWFYCDCLKTFYNTEMWDERHWKIIENFMTTAVENGVNMILTPVFTYALDTAVGHERPTTQLVDVTKNENGRYSFGFSRFERFIETAKRAGYKYFEMGHLFTQWGAKHTPKVIAATPDGVKQIFGWDTDSTDPEYHRFLRAFLTALKEETEKLKIDKVTYYHLSDEPREANIDAYRMCYNLVSSIVPADRIIDAMSNLSFYENKVLTRPIPSTANVGKFIDAKVPGLWTYYCCTERVKLSNRYFAMPLHRTRALGVQLYRFNIEGFLHWGYNFYYSQFSLYPINPFFQTDCDGFAESGDAFLVYPGPSDMPYESLRLKAMRDAMQDIRLLQLLEDSVGRDRVLKMIGEELGEISFSEYPRESDAYINLRERLIKELKSIK